MDQSYLLIFENFEDILAKKIVLNDALYEAMEVARVFPKQYLDTLKRLEMDEEEKKRLLLCDVKRRRNGYRTFSEVMKNCYNFCDLEKEAASLPDFYKPNNKLCLILNNEKFRDKELDCKEPDRQGSSKDVELLRETFLKIKYEVEIHSDLDRECLEELTYRIQKDGVLKRFQPMNEGNVHTLTRYSQFDMLVILVMSHGNETGIKTVDGLVTPFHQFLCEFSNQSCEIFAGKPKIFIFNCCRLESDDFVRMQAKLASQDRTPPQDTYVIYSTLNYLKSNRCKESGSLFASALSYGLENCRDKEIGRVGIRINRRLEQLMGQRQKSNDQLIEWQAVGASKQLRF